MGLPLSYFDEIRIAQREWYKQKQETQMTKFRLEDGCTYETRTGEKVTVKERRNGMFDGECDNGTNAVYSPGGTYWFYEQTHELELDLIRKIEPPPAPLECWVNVYSGTHGYAHRTESDARTLVDKGAVRIAVHMREVMK